MYEVALQHEAQKIYAQVWQYFVYGLLLLMLGVSLGSKFFISVMVTPAYADAANLIPVVCLAYFFFSLHGHFNIPVLLAKRSSYLIPTYVIAALANIGFNMLTIPWFGIAGAAWASVFTFILFSFGGLWRYRAIDRYPYPLVRCGGSLLGMIASYVIYHRVETLYPHHWATYGLAVFLWLAWATLLLSHLVSKLFYARGNHPALHQEK